MIGYALLGLAALAVFGGSMGTSLLHQLVKAQNGLLVADDLTSLREVGYKRAAELGFTDASPSKAVLLALAKDRVGLIAPVKGVQLGTLYSSTWDGLLAHVTEFYPTWGDVKDRIDDVMEEQGML